MRLCVISDGHSAEAWCHKRKKRIDRPLVVYVIAIQASVFVFLFFFFEDILSAWSFHRTHIHLSQGVAAWSRPRERHLSGLNRPGTVSVVYLRSAAGALHDTQSQASGGCSRCDLHLPVFVHLLTIPSNGG